MRKSDIKYKIYDLIQSIYFQLFYKYAECLREVCYVVVEKIYFALSLLIFFCGFAEQSVAMEYQDQQHLCVQTLNTYGVFYADNLVERHEQTLHFLRNNICDINLLQEVIDESHYNNLLELSNELNMTTAYFSKQDDNKGSGLMGMFRGDMINMDIQYFPDFRNRVVDFLYQSFQSLNKGFGVVQLHHSNLKGNALLVLNLHLDHISQEARISQILFLLRWILYHPYWWDTLFIVGGDLNFPPDSLEFNMMKYLLRFQDPYDIIGKERFCTHWCEDSDYDVLNTLFGGQIRDYVLFKSSTKLHIQPVDIDVFPKKHNGIHLSDHYGVRAFFSFAPTPYDKKQDSLKEKATDFKRVLEDVRHVIGDSMNREEIQFIHTLDQDLDQSYSNIIEYLKLN